MRRRRRARWAWVPRLRATGSVVVTTTSQLRNDRKFRAPSGGVHMRTRSGEQRLDLTGYVVAPGIENSDTATAIEEEGGRKAAHAEAAGACIVPP